MSLKLILCLCLLARACQGERVRYDNYRVYKAIASMPSQMKVLKNLEGAGDSIMFLDDISPISKAINVIVAPHKVPDFIEIMSTNKVNYELLDNNLQRHLEDVKEHVGDSYSNAQAVSYDWTQYYKLNDTYNWLQQLAIKNTGVVTIIECGRSYHGRSIMGVKISKSKTERPGIFVEAGTHAREWIGPATATYLINELLTSNNTAIKEIAENYTWYILPHTNPDGYVYTHTTDRLWRKTRTPYGRCFGVDLNRNWDIVWNTIDSDMPCSINYAGPSAFSEIETRSLSQYIGTLRGKMSLYISFHANYQKLLFPYGYTSTFPANYRDLKQVYDVSIAALKKRYGTGYTGGNIYHNIYPVSGASIDWVYAHGTKMAFCYELRPPKGYPHSFELPADQIIPTGEETVDSIVAMVNEVKKLGYFK